MNIGLDNVIDPDQIEAHLTKQRKSARAELKKSGSLNSERWQFGVTLWKNGVGRPSKYKSPDEMRNHGEKYFEYCAKKDEIPIRSGLILWLGFPTNSAWLQWTRTNPEYRPVFGELNTLLAIPLEMMLTETGVNTTGALFRLKNIPEGLLPGDNAQQASRYDWKERKATEVSGLDGAPLVNAGKLDAEEVYRKMLEAGARLTGEGAKDSSTQHVLTDGDKNE